MKKPEMSPIRKYHQSCVPPLSPSTPNQKKQNPRHSLSTENVRMKSKSTKKLQNNNKKIISKNNQASPYKSKQSKVGTATNIRNSSKSKQKSPYTKKISLPGQKYQQSLQDFLQTHRKDRYNAISALDTYTLLISTECPLRCLLHNSAISLYCQSEQKLLCANCVYGSNHHRAHKIYPIERVMNKINSDIENMKNCIIEDNKQLIKIEDILYDRFDAETQSLHHNLQEITNKYQFLRQALDKSELTAKSNLYKLIENIRTKNQQLLLELGSVRKLYDQYNPTRKFHDPHSLRDNEQDAVLYQHLSYNVLCNLKKIDDYYWIPPENQIQNLASAELKKINLILEKIQLNVVAR